MQKYSSDQSVLANRFAALLLVSRGGSDRTCKSMLAVAAARLRRGLRLQALVGYLDGTLRRLEYLPCVPTRVTKVPAGPDWLRVIKHDGHQLIVLRFMFTFVQHPD